jgi:hypothetical protein
MGNGFIPRQVQSTGQVLCRLNGLFLHHKILARGAISLRITRGRLNFHFQISIFRTHSCPSGQVFAGHSLYQTLKSKTLPIRIIS